MSEEGEGEGEADLHIMSNVGLPDKAWGCLVLSVPYLPLQILLLFHYNQLLHNIIPGPVSWAGPGPGLQAHLIVELHLRMYMPQKLNQMLDAIASYIVRVF